MAKETSFSLRSLLEKQTLKADGSNFTDWFRTLTIVLRREKKEYVLNTPVTAVPAADGKAEDVAKYNKHIEDELDVQSLLVGIMGPELQRRFMDTNTYDMCDQLKNMFQEQSRVERFKVTKSLISHKLTEGGSVGTHMLRMTSDIEQLEKLNSPLSKEFATDIILHSLPPSYSGFIMNFHMLGMEKSLQELQGMLRIADDDMKKNSSILMIQAGSRKIKKTPKKMAPKYKGKGKQILKPNPPKIKVAASSDCFYCHSKGHWKRNCPKYLTDMKAGKVPKASTSGIYVIEVNVATSINDWVLDTGSCAHICSNMQVLKNRRKLRNKEIQLQVGNGARVAAVTAGSIELYLPSGLVMELDNVYFVPSISRNIISISCLEMNGFSFVIKDNRCSIYKDELYYGSSFMMNDLYILEMNKLVFNINNK